MGWGGGRGGEHRPRCSATVSWTQPTLCQRRGAEPPTSGHPTTRPPTASSRGPPSPRAPHLRAGRRREATAQQARHSTAQRSTHLGEHQVQVALQGVAKQEGVLVAVPLEHIHQVNGHLAQPAGTGVPGVRVFKNARAVKDGSIRRRPRTHGGARTQAQAACAVGVCRMQLRSRAPAGHTQCCHSGSYGLLAPARDHRTASRAGRRPLARGGQGLAATHTEAACVGGPASAQHPLVHGARHVLEEHGGAWLARSTHDGDEPAPHVPVDLEVLGVVLELVSLQRLGLCSGGQRGGSGRRDHRKAARQAAWAEVRRCRSDDRAPGCAARHSAARAERSGRRARQSTAGAERGASAAPTPAPDALAPKGSPLLRSAVWISAMRA